MSIIYKKAQKGSLVNIYQLILRVLAAIAALSVLTKINGSKLISQMTSYDYITSIVVGSLAAILSIDSKINAFYIIIAISMFMFSSLLTAFLSRKSIKIRRILNGDPIFLVADGEIQYDGIKRAKFNVNLLLSELRSLGYFDINDIKYAILESKGALSVLPKGFARNVKVSDLNIPAQDDSLLANVIIDGKIISGNLQFFRKDEAWLHGELKKQNASIKDILLATINENCELAIHARKDMCLKKVPFV